MEQIWQCGLDIIHFVQKIRSPFFDSFFSAVSFFGTVSFYIVFLPVLYWCSDKRHARRLLLIFLVSGWINSVCKDIFNHPRPYNLDESVKIGRTGGPGLPSGHAQQSLTVWGYLSLWMKQASFTYISIIVILLIAFSRIYLGVHFPTDIAGGWIIALVVLFAGFYSADRIEQFVNRIDRRIAVVFLILLPVMLSLFYPSSSSLMSMGTFSGAAIGIVIETGAINFQPVKSLKQGLIRYCSGIIVLGIIYYTGRLLPAKNTHAGMFAVYIHSWIMGIVVSAGMPLIYKRAGV